MLPVIAIVGRPNVGKSTLFNRLTKSRDALVVDQPGVTRDRLYGEANIAERKFIVIDTGGLTGEKQGIEVKMATQALQAITEADAVLLLVDARSGLTAADEIIVKQLRGLNKKLHLVLNKIDGVDQDLAATDFQRLGLGDPLPISASNNRGIVTLVEAILPPFAETEQEFETADGVKVAVVGRPNAGKSTLLNRILGEERVLVYDMPGTTRDSIYINFERRGKHYTLIDTAGVRRRTKVKERVEKFSVIKTLQAVEDANVVILVIDARENIAEQDLRLISFIVDAGRGLLIAINKWDNLSVQQRVTIKNDLDRRLRFLNFAATHFISALHGTGVGDLFNSVDKAFASATKKISRPMLNKILEKAITQNPPPLVHGRRIKLRYAHTGGHNPPIIVIHGNQTKAVPDAYKRYLEHYFVKALKLVGTPVRIEFKSGENPYEGKRNKLTPRQQRRRKRLIKHVKK